MKAQLGLGFERGAHGAQAHFHIVGQHVAGRVGDVDAVGAIALHQQPLAHQLFGAGHVGHHQEADGVQAQFTRLGDVLLRDIGFGAVGGDADGGDAQILGHQQMLDSADTGDQQRRHFGALHQRDHGFQVFLVGVGRKAVVDRATAEAVAVRDFNQRHPGGVQAAGDAFHLLQRHQMALGVHAVAQSHVVDGDFFAL